MYHFYRIITFFQIHKTFKYQILPLFFYNLIDKLWIKYKNTTQVVNSKKNISIGMLTLPM